MNAKIESVGQFNWLKWLILILLFIGGLIANYYFSSVATPIRIIGWLILVAVLLGLAAWTPQGKFAYQFIGQARQELRRVAWPTKQETIRTTAVVVVLVVTAGLLLWGIDTLLMLLISWLSG